jgi:hypothetical protein
VRWSSGCVPLLALLVFLTVLPAGADPRGGESDPEPDRPTRAEGDFGRSGAECRTAVEGSEVIAYCHNPYPTVYRVTLHVECVDWWDIDTDGTPVDADPARTVRLSGRCWKDVATTWITQHPH